MSVRGKSRGSRVVTSASAWLTSGKLVAWVSMQRAEWLRATSTIPPPTGPRWCRRRRRRTCPCPSGPGCWGARSPSSGDVEVERELLGVGAAAQHALAPGEGVAQAVSAVAVAGAAEEGRLAARLVAPGHRVGAGQRVAVVGEALGLNPEPVQPQPPACERTDDLADLAGGLAAAH